MSLEAETAHWRAAVVSMLLSDGQWVSAPAVFLFDTPTGWAWVEPSYADPMGAASPALHERDGQPERLGTWYRYRPADGAAIEVWEFDPEDGNGNDIVEAITWWESWLASEGRTRAQERERLRAEIWPATEGEDAEA